MKRKVISLLLCAAMVFTMAACGKTKKPSGSSGGASEGSVTLRVLGYSAQESSLNILRDQLTKAGFNVDLNTQPDYSSLSLIHI